MANEVVAAHGGWRVLVWSREHDGPELLPVAAWEVVQPQEPCDCPPKVKFHATNCPNFPAVGLTSVPRWRVERTKVELVPLVLGEDWMQVAPVPSGCWFVDPGEMAEWCRDHIEEVQAMMARHDAAEHGGNPCLAERAAFVAFFAHGLGIRASDPQSVMATISLLVEYEGGRGSPVMAIVEVGSKKRYEERRGPKTPPILQ